MRGARRAATVTSTRCLMPGSIVGLVLVALLAGCAAHRLAPAELEGGQRQSRFERRRSERETRGMGAELEMSLWAKRSGSRDLPGVEARTLLGAPDAFRMRILSAFGTALDVAARGDSLSAYMPKRRVGIVVASSLDSLGLRDPGGLGCRILSAAWKPSPEAWTHTAWSDSLAIVHWLDHGDSLEMTVGSNGLPASIRLARKGSTALIVHYPSWFSADNVFWPRVISFEDGNGSWSLSCRIERLRLEAHADRERLALRLPAGAERLTPSDLKRLFERLAEL